MYREKDKSRQIMTKICMNPSTAKKRVAVEEPLEDGRMCGQDGCWGKRPAHAHTKSGERYKDTFGVEPFAQERQNLSRDEKIARNGKEKEKKKKKAWPFKKTSQG